jgi:hypothetical protein
MIADSGDGDHAMRAGLGVGRLASSDHHGQGGTGFALGLSFQVEAMGVVDKTV